MRGFGINRYTDGTGNTLICASLGSYFNFIPWELELNRIEGNNSEKVCYLVVKIDLLSIKGTLPILILILDGAQIYN